MISARNELGIAPVTEGQLGRRTPLFAERYLFSGRDQKMAGRNGAVMIVHFGGAKVEETEPASDRTISVPGRVLLLAPQIETRWQYSGTADFGIFYFPDRAPGLVGKVKDIAVASGTTIAFTDPLVSASALELMHELGRSERPNDHFAVRLAQVMLEQTLRVVEKTHVKGTLIRNLHLSRMEKTVDYIKKNVNGDLSAGQLARQLGMSSTHLSRIFREEFGVSLHTFIVDVRLGHARGLLAATTIPIARAALESGFSSQSHLTKAFRQAHGTTPARFRRDALA